MQDVKSYKELSVEVNLNNLSVFVFVAIKQP